MKDFTDRAMHSLRRAAIRSACADQETQETVARAGRSLRALCGVSRVSLRVLLSCAALGLALMPVRAQDTAKPADQDKPADKATEKPAQAAAQAQTGPAPGSVSLSGLIDVYYGINTRAPSSVTNGPFSGVTTPTGDVISIDNVGRSFDINDRDPSLSLGELNIVRTAGKGFPLGVTATLTIGETARLVHATEPGGTGWNPIQQLYLTYTGRLFKRDLTIDFGTFVTPFGQEVIESSSNDEYSRGLLFQFAIPLYHAGLRASLPITPTISATAFVVNGWNDIADDNNAKSLGIQIGWKPTNSIFSATATFMGGSEGTGAYGSGILHNGGNITTNVFEFAPTVQLTPKLKLAAEIDYGNAAGDALFVGAPNSVHVSGNWLGFAGYARYQITPVWAVAARAEQFEDMPGANGFVPRGTGPAYQKLNSATLTLEYLALRSHLVTRLEYRHDHSRSPIFGESRGRVVPDQDTLYLSEVYKF